MIRKAVITAAGKGTRQYPATNAVQKELFPLVDRDGITKPTIQIIVEEAIAAGIEEVCIVVQPEMEERFKEHFHPLSKMELPASKDKGLILKQSELLEKLQQAITYVQQTSQDGFGHAVYCTRDWVGGEPFLLMLGDHIYISGQKESCASQLMNGFRQFNKSTYAVKQTPAELIYLFGAVTGMPISEGPAAYQLTNVKEKPDVSYARQYLKTAGMPEDTFLTFFGMHILTPGIFTVLQEHIAQNIREKGEIQLTAAQAELCRREGAIGLEIDGLRLDMGTPLGYLETQMALALQGVFAHDFDLSYRKLRNG